VTDGTIFRAINKAGRSAPTGFSPKVIWGVVKEASARCGLTKVAPTIFAEHARACVTKPGENLNRFSSCLGTSASKRLNGISAVNSD
jgi:hypothetical protein